MTPDTEDALYTACAVTTHSAKTGRMQIADHPRAVGTARNPPSSVRELRAKVIALLGELDATMTVGELLDDLKET